MSAIAASFNSRIRDAGDIERDSKIYGSFRSMSRFGLESADSQQQRAYGERRNSRHEDIFVQNVSLMQPAVEGDAIKVVAPLPPAPSHHSSKSSKDGAINKRSKKSESKKPPRPKVTSESDETKRHNVSVSKNDQETNDLGVDDELMETLRRRASRQRRRQREKENREPLEENKFGLNTSLNEPAPVDKDNIVKNRGIYI